MLCCVFVVCLWIVVFGLVELCFVVCFCDFQCFVMLLCVVVFCVVL